MINNINTTVTIKLLKCRSIGNPTYYQFQIVGLPTDPKWLSDWQNRITDQRLPCCEFSIFVSSELLDSPMQLGSYGGDVWPTAWPQFFVVPDVKTCYNVGAVMTTVRGQGVLRDIVASANQGHGMEFSFWMEL